MDEQSGGRAHCDPVAIKILTLPPWRTTFGAQDSSEDKRVVLPGDFHGRHYENFARLEGSTTEDGNREMAEVDGAAVLAASLSTTTVL